MIKESNEKRNNSLAVTLLTLVMLMWMPKASAQVFEYPEYEGQERIAVAHQGNSPTISDFATAFLNFMKENAYYEKVYADWQRYRQKKALDKNVSIIVDTKNGYIRYKVVNPEEKDTTVTEMCFWNCADGKRKLLCANTFLAMENDYGWDEHVGVWFYVYDNKTGVMRPVLAEDIGALFDGDGISVFSLPRKGKNIKVTTYSVDERWEVVLEWDGFQFQ